MNSKNLYHFSGIDYLIAGFAATGLILLYLFFSSSPHVYFGILHSWFAYYVLFYAAMMLFAAYKLGIQSRSSRLLARWVVIFGIVSIFAFFAVIFCIGFYPIDTKVTAKAAPVLEKPSLGAIFYAPFFFMEWVQSPLTKYVGVALVYFGFKALKVIKKSLKAHNSG